MGLIDRIGRFGILGIAAIFIIVSLAYAQAGPRRSGWGERPAMRALAGTNMWRATDRLGLSEEQKTQVRERLQKCRDQRIEIWNSNISPEEKRARLLELKAQCLREVSEVLTPEQREQARNLWRERATAGWRPGAVGRALEALNLTPEQKAKIDSIRKETQERVWSIRTDTRLTEKEKAEKIASVRRIGHEQVMGVLTPEQKAKIEAWRASCPRLGIGFRGMRGSGLGFGARRGAP